MLWGVSAGLAAVHGQLLSIAYSTAEPIMSTPAATSAAQGAGASWVGRRFSSGITTTPTLATISAAANTTKVTIRSGRPLPEARYPGRRAQSAAAQRGRIPARRREA